MDLHSEAKMLAFARMVVMVLTFDMESGCLLRLIKDRDQRSLQNRWNCAYDLHGAM